jgi:lysyl-tRNA synthetase, class II
VSELAPPSDPLLAALQAEYHGFGHDDTALRLLAGALDERARGLLGRVAVGMSVPDLAVERGTSVPVVRAELAEVLAQLARLRVEHHVAVAEPSVADAAPVDADHDAADAEIEGDAAAGTSSGDAQRAQRLATLDALRAQGVDPYPVGFQRSATTAELRARYAHLEPGAETDDHVVVAGRVVLLRDQGKLAFVTLRDGSGTIQLFASKADMGDDAFAALTAVDLGDWIGASGRVIATRRGELSVRLDGPHTLLAKAVRPLPDKWHGLSDVDTRFRQRYVDLIVNEDARRAFEVRFATVASLRRTLSERGFVEVETPVLQPQAGGATAKPFLTHHNALDMELSLRIAPELYLKRLLVGGYERVFEIARVFRNEGISTRHNPEFTMLECYQAIADYHDMMELTEALVSEAALAALGTTVVTQPRADGSTVEIDLAPPWPRRAMADLIEEHTGFHAHPGRPIEELRAAAVEHGVRIEDDWGPGKLVLELYEKTTEHALVGPIFVCDYPVEVSPLAHRHRTDPLLVERFEVIVNGRELGNAFSELTDPIDQRARFEEQAALKAAGDDEAHGVDEDYVRALEYGLPPAGGLGIGVDRLVMLLAGTGSIREVVLFPHLRPERF